MLARLETDYEQPLGCREEVAVGCRILRIRARLGSYVLHKNARAYTAKASIVIPERWREIITACELIATTLGS
jgi:hypothetical protein